MVSRIGDQAQSRLVGTTVTRTQDRLRDAQLSISTGRAARSYAELPDQAAQLLRAGKEQASAAARIEQGQQVVDRLQAMDGALAGIGDVAERFRVMLLERLDGTGQSAPLADQADSALDGITARLNLKVDGRYLFAGSQTAKAPVQLPTPPPTTADPALYYQGDGVTLTLRTAADAELAYGVTAADPSFALLISALGQARAGHLANDRTGLESALADLDQAISGLADLRGVTAARAAELGDRVEQQRATALQLSDLTNRITATDLPSAMTELAQHQAVLEASYLITGRLGSLSLADYLR